MKTKKEQLIHLLTELKNIGDIEGSSVVSRDGLVIASDLMGNVDEETFAAMSAAMQGAAETAVSELKKGDLNQVIIEAARGKIITISAGKLAILVAMTKPNVNLGLAILEIKKIGRKISNILGS